MASVNDIPVEVWSVIINENFEIVTHDALHGLVMIFNGALGQKVAAKARAGYGLVQRNLFRSLWAADHHDSYEEASIQARILALQGECTELQLFLNAHPDGDGDPAVAAVQSTLALRLVELNAHYNYQNGWAARPGPVAGCRPVDLVYPPGPGRDTVGEVFNAGCFECFHFMFLSQNHPLSIGGYDERGQSYIGKAAAMPPWNGTQERILHAMVQAAGLDDLLNIEQITMHNPDGADEINTLRNIGRWESVRNAWIDHFYALTVVPAVGIPVMIAMPLTHQELTKQSRGSEYWMRYLDFTHYIRAFNSGLQFCEMNDPIGETSSWFSLLQRRPTNDTRNILTHMCRWSTDGINEHINIGFPRPGVNGIPGLNEFPTLRATSSVPPWFMALWRGQRDYARIMAGALRVRKADVCKIKKGSGPLVDRLIGYAAIQHMNNDGVAMLRDWLDSARDELTQAGIAKYGNIIDLINDVLDHYSRLASQIDDLYRAIVRGAAPPPVLNPGVTLQQAEAEEMATLQGHASDMIDALMTRSIRSQMQMDIMSEVYDMTLVDTQAFIDYVRDDIAPRQRSRDYRYRRQRPLLNRIMGSGGRITRSRCRSGG